MVREQQIDNRTVYQIRVQGKLDERWTDWFSGMRIVTAERDQHITTLTGPVDQAAMRGILNRIWDLNLTLISVGPIQADETPNGGEL